MIVKLPEIGRPIIRYRQCALGIDLPAWFMYDLWSIDRAFFPIFHIHRLLWDDIVNDGSGELDNPRYPVLENSFKAGELTMGFILTDGQGRPIPDGKWHLWRLCSPVNSWAHIVPIECKDLLYLKLLVERIWLQAKYNDRYGNRGYQRMMEQLDIERRTKIQDEKQDLMGEIHKVNSAMVNRAMQNFEYGRVEPTRPKKDIIVSGAGLTKRSKITRDITDAEGGLVLPDKI
jgi:hypothetical protein